MRMGGRRETHPPHRVRTLPSKHCLAEVIFHPQMFLLREARVIVMAFFLTVVYRVNKLHVSLPQRGTEQVCG